MKILYHDIVTPCGQPADVVISGLQKFIRRGMTEEAVRAAYELFLTGEELTEYLWKRLLVISAEDIGMGNPMATIVVEALQNAAARITRENPGNSARATTDNNVIILFTSIQSPNQCVIKSKIASSDKDESQTTFT